MRQRYCPRLCAMAPEAQAHKTEQDYEAGDQHPAAHPLR
jgi:hypothetical protein